MSKLAVINWYWPFEVENYLFFENLVVKCEFLAFRGQIMLHIYFTSLELHNAQIITCKVFSKTFLPLWTSFVSITTELFCPQNASKWLISMDTGENSAYWAYKIFWSVTWFLIFFQPSYQEKRCNKIANKVFFSKFMVFWVTNWVDLFLSQPDRVETHCRTKLKASKMFSTLKAPL